MPRILRSKTFWIGVGIGTIAGPFVVKRVTGIVKPISDINVQR